MAHKVTVSMNENFVLHKDLKVDIKSDGKSLGNLLISKGNIEWRPTKNHVNKFQLKWEKLAELMEEHGKPVKIKKS